MKEEFLHYIWQYKKFNWEELQTVSNEKLIILNSGMLINESGPDFFNAQIILNKQKWAGNIEIHVRSSDWYVHNHEKDSNYDSVILHVVWEYDVPVFRVDNSEIPVLELKRYVDKKTLSNYQDLFLPKTWINCEKVIESVDDFVFQNWMECLYFQRLDRKSAVIQDLLAKSNNDWEGVLFCLLAKNFGLNVNSESFYKMATFIPFSIIRKESAEVQNLEALFFGLLNLFPEKIQDVYGKDLKCRYEYLKMKYRFEEFYANEVQFYRLRPDNFPTIRLAQLAVLYSKRRNLFTQVIGAADVKSIYKVFDVSVSDYWIDHYHIDKVGMMKTKKMTKSFVDLLIINSVVPMKFAYANSLGKDITEEIVELLEKIKPEKNSIIDNFVSRGVKVKNVFQTQSLIELKKEYCNFNQCLKCAIGNCILKN